MECLRDIDRLLAQRAVRDKQHLVGLHAGAKPFHFLNQVGVDLEPSGGIEEDAVTPGGYSSGEGCHADGGHILRGAVGVELEFLLLGQDLKLVDGRGPVDVAGGDERAVAAFLEQLAELGGGGGLAGAVEADHHDLERPGSGEAGCTLAEQADELVVDDLDDLLAGGDGLEHVLTDALGLHALDELPGDLEMDVGGEEGGAHLLEGLRHVGFRELADAPQVAEGAAKFVGEGFEHGTTH